MARGYSKIKKIKNTLPAYRNSKKKETKAAANGLSIYW